ncbi:Ribonuclease VapC2 [Moorella humiferrea]|uniref:type II toxin-antitoxin system VapC family toxin n=1 Tax=Neomoorella humiferrea TaxID=676965 RepID=UPI0030CB7982
MGVVTDTSIIIGFLKGHQPEVDYVEQALRNGTLTITAITVFELKVGLPANSKRERLLTKFFQQVTILPFDGQAALAAAMIENRLRSGGEGIGVPDTLIAGICLARNLSLLTLNIEHFKRVPGLEVLTPVSLSSPQA